mmetsp:Transcript_24354/g.61711  ORF Transcript_24354/g.61711 Transcript_24354/m.61711 type:complete len:203 (+) Transcript_24354:2573-3181(+)
MLRKSGLGPSAEPLGKSVCARERVDGLIRKCRVQPHERGDVGSCSNGLPIRASNLHRAEVQRLLEEVADLDRERRALLVDESRAEVHRFLAHQLLRRLNDHIDGRFGRLDVLDEFKSCLGTPGPLLGEGNVRDDRHRGVFVAIVNIERLLIVGSEQHLRPRLHAVETLSLRHALVLQRGALLDQLGVDHRKVLRVEFDVVFD